MTEERYCSGRHVASFKASDALITSVRIVTDSGPHARITVFNRGGNAGTITVDTADAHAIAVRLLPEWESAS